MAEKMILYAVMNRKADCYETKKCVVEKVIDVERYNRAADRLEVLGMLKSLLGAEFGNSGKSDRPTLSMQEYVLMKKASEAKNGNADLIGIREFLAISKAAVSQMLSSLERRGLINREVDPQNRRKQLQNADVRVNGVIAIGYGQTQGVPHISKTAAEISRYIGNEPQWFKDGVEALLCAPTALNKQPYMVTGDGNKVTLTAGEGYFSGIDLGIGKYHFEVGAGKENFEWV